MLGNLLNDSWGESKSNSFKVIFIVIYCVYRTHINNIRNWLRL